MWRVRRCRSGIRGSAKVQSRASIPQTAALCTGRIGHITPGWGIRAKAVAISGERDRRSVMVPVTVPGRRRSSIPMGSRSLHLDSSYAQSWKRYVLNNPLANVDPLGTCSVKKGDTETAGDLVARRVAGGDTGVSVDGGQTAPVEVVLSDYNCPDDCVEVSGGDWCCVMAHITRRQLYETFRRRLG